MRRIVERMERIQGLFKISLIYNNADLLFASRSDFYRSPSPSEGSPSRSPSPVLPADDEDVQMDIEDPGPELPGNIPLHNSAGRRANEQHLRQEIFVKAYPSPHAGAPLQGNAAPGDFQSYANAVHAIEPS